MTKQANVTMLTFEVSLRRRIQLVRLCNGLQQFLNDDTVVDTNITTDTTTCTHQHCHQHRLDKTKFLYISIKLQIKQSTWTEQGWCYGSPLQQNSLRWYGHVLRKDDNDWVKKCMEYKVLGSIPRGRPIRTWLEIAKYVDWAGMMLWFVVDGGSW